MPEGPASMHDQADGAKDNRFTKLMVCASGFGLIILCGIVTVVLVLSLSPEMRQMDTSLTSEEKCMIIGKMQLDQEFTEDHLSKESAVYWNLSREFIGSMDDIFQARFMRVYLHTEVKTLRNGSIVVVFEIAMSSAKSGSVVVVFEIAMSSAKLVSQSHSNTSKQIASIVKKVIENGAQIGQFGNLKLVDGRVDIDEVLTQNKEGVVDKWECEDGFECDEGLCQSPTSRCDGISQCNDGYDELDCSKSASGL